MLVQLGFDGADRIIGRPVPEFLFRGEPGSCPYTVPSAMRFGTGLDLADRAQVQKLILDSNEWLGSRESAELCNHGWCERARRQHGQDSCAGPALRTMFNDPPHELAQLLPTLEPAAQRLRGFGGATTR